MLTVKRNDIRPDEYEFFNNGEFCGTLAVGLLNGGEASLTSGLEAFRLSSELHFGETRYQMQKVTLDTGTTEAPLISATGGSIGIFAVSIGDRRLQLAKKGLFRIDYEISESFSILGAIKMKGWSGGKWKIEMTKDLELRYLQFIFWLVISREPKDSYD